MTCARDYALATARTMAPPDVTRKALERDNDVDAVHGLLGLATEALETVEATRKLTRAPSDPDLVRKLIEEIGDALWYASLLARSVTFYSDPTISQWPASFEYMIAAAIELVDLPDNVMGGLIDKDARRQSLERAVEELTQQAEVLASSVKRALFAGTRLGRPGTRISNSSLPNVLGGAFDAVEEARADNERRLARETATAMISTLASLAFLHATSLEDAMRGNIAKIAARYPDAWSADALYGRADESGL